MKLLLPILFLLSQPSLALVDDIFNISMTLIDRSNEAKEYQSKKHANINQHLLVKKTCEASILLSKKRLERQSSKMFSKISNTDNKVKFLNIYLTAQNNLYKKLILCNKTAIIGIKKYK